MNDPFASRLRESLSESSQEPAIVEKAIDAGLRRRRVRRSTIGGAGVVFGGLVFLSLGALFSAPVAQDHTAPIALQRVVQRVDIPVFSRPISAADRAASWTILSIEGATTP